MLLFPRWVVAEIQAVHVSWHRGYKDGDYLRAPGSLSYSRMRELFMAIISELGFNPNKFGLHFLACVLVGPLRLSMLVYQTACLNAMAVGVWSLPKMDILRIQCPLFYQFLQDLIFKPATPVLCGPKLCCWC